MSVTPSTLRPAAPATKRVTVILGKDAAAVVDYGRGHAVLVEGDIVSFAAGEWAERYDYANRHIGAWVVEAIDPEFDRRVTLPRGARFEVDTPLHGDHWVAREAVSLALARTQTPRRWTF